MRFTMCSWDGASFAEMTRSRSPGSATVASSLASSASIVVSRRRFRTAHFCHSEPLGCVQDRLSDACQRTCFRLSMVARHQILRRSTP